MARFIIKWADSEGHRSTTSMQVSSGAVLTPAVIAAFTNMTDATRLAVDFVDDHPVSLESPVAGSDNEIGGVFGFVDGFGNVTPISVPAIRGDLKIANSDDLDITDAAVVAFTDFITANGRNLGDAVIAFNGVAKERYTGRISS